MNTGSILMLLPLLIIFSYLFDLLAKKTIFPSVILLMITGIIARTVANQYGFDNTFLLNSLIPVLGTIGLILIVMEGALELEIKKEKLGLIFSGFFAAFVILILNLILLKSFFVYALEIPNQKIDDSITQIINPNIPDLLNCNREIHSWLIKKFQYH